MQKKTPCKMRTAFHSDTVVLNICATLMISLCLIGAVYPSSVLAAPGYRSQRTGDAEGEALYKRHCSVCHGDRGSGSSKASHDLIPPPRDFSAASDLTRETMISVITNGKPGTAMMGWKSRFSDKEIGAVADYIRGRFMLVALNPQIAKGRGVYGHFCQVCHGDRGQGVKSNEMAGTPRDLTLPHTQVGLTRERMIASVTHGKHGTVKTGFGEKLSAEHIGAAVDYIREVMIPSLSKSDPVSHAASPVVSQTANPVTQTGSPQPIVQAPSDMGQPLPKGLKGNARSGEQFYMANCATCHGKKGDGQGPRAYFINPVPRNFLDHYSHTTLNRPTIFFSVTNGRPGTEMPAWDKVLTEQEIANVAEFVFRTFTHPDTGAKANVK